MFERFVLFERIIVLERVLVFELFVVLEQLVLGVGVPRRSGRSWPDRPGGVTQARPASSSPTGCRRPV